MGKMIELNFRPDARTLRQFGFIAVVGFGALAAMAYFEEMLFSFGLGQMRVEVAVALGAVGILSGLFSLFAPRANWPLYVALSVVTFPIGFVLSHIIMGALFFALIAPVAMLFRVVGRDPLALRYDTSASSYWCDPRPNRDTHSYFRQF